MRLDAYGVPEGDDFDSDSWLLDKAVLRKRLAISESERITHRWSSRITDTQTLIEAWKAALAKTFRRASGALKRSLCTAQVQLEVLRGGWGGL